MDPYYILIIQILADIIIIAIMFYILKQIKDKNYGDIKRVMDMIQQLCEESKRLSLEFEKNLNERKMIINSIISQIDNKILKLKELSALYNFDSDGEKDNISEKTEEIIELLNRGKSIEDIAKELSISKEEVKLVVDLKSSS